MNGSQENKDVQAGASSASADQKSDGATSTQTSPLGGGPSSSSATSDATNERLDREIGEEAAQGTSESFGNPGSNGDAPPPSPPNFVSFAAEDPVPERLAVTPGRTIDPHLLLAFGRHVLFTLAVLVVFFALLSMFGPIAVTAWASHIQGNAASPSALNVDAVHGAVAAGEHAFDVVKTVIPPVVTLVLGFYFGRRSD